MTLSKAQIVFLKALKESKLFTKYWWEIKALGNCVYQVPLQSNGVALKSTLKALAKKGLIQYRIEKHYYIINVNSKAFKELA